MSGPSQNKNVVLTSIKRFEQSPYLHCYDKPGVISGVYAGRFFPLYYGDDPAEKYWVLRRKAALYDVPEKPMEISGPDVLPFLERIFSRKVSMLQEGRGLYAIACTPKGGVFMDGILFKMGKDRYWYIQPDGDLETWLIAHSGEYEVQVSNPKSRVLQIQGPASMKILNAATDGKIDESLKYFQSGRFEFNGQELYVSRTGFTGELGYEIYSFGDQTDHESLWHHLVKCGEPFGMEFSGPGSMETRRIEAGILDNKTDMDMSMTPFQAGLGRFVDMEKENFIGRSALINADRSVLLYGITCEKWKPLMYEPILDLDKQVGYVTAGAWSPYLDKGVGYVRFSNPGSWAGKSLTIHTSNNDYFDCEVCELPFYDKDKRIPRGFDSEIP